MKEITQEYTVEKTNEIIKYKRKESEFVKISFDDGEIQEWKVPGRMYTANITYITVNKTGNKYKVLTSDIEYFENGIETGHIDTHIQIYDPDGVRIHNAKLFNTEFTKHACEWISRAEKMNAEKKE